MLGVAAKSTSTLRRRNFALAQSQRTMHDKSTIATPDQASGSKMLTSDVQLSAGATSLVLHLLNRHGTALQDALVQPVGDPTPQEALVHEWPCRFPPVAALRRMRCIPGLPGTYGFGCGGTCRSAFMRMVGVIVATLVRALLSKSQRERFGGEVTQARQRAVAHVNTMDMRQVLGWRALDEMAGQWSEETRTVRDWSTVASDSPAGPQTRWPWRRSPGRPERRRGSWDSRP